MIKGEASRTKFINIVGKKLIFEDSSIEQPL